jgi:hypothetical protein
VSFSICQSPASAEDPKPTRHIELRRLALDASAQLGSQGLECLASLRLTQARNRSSASSVCGQLTGTRVVRLGVDQLDVQAGARGR